MTIQGWTYVMVGLTFGIYLTIAWMSRVKDTKGFYVAGGGVPALANGMATAADWMSAASFISMAGLISFLGYSGAVYLMGWTGGYVLLALLLAPYLRKFGKFTVPDFVGDRYYSKTARIVALICAIVVSMTYVAGQMRGVGIVFSRFLGTDVNTGVLIGMVIVFLYAGLGGMKGITWTQVAQYVVLILAYIIPAAAISLNITGNPIPQLGFGGTIASGPDAGVFLLDALDKINVDLGLAAYTSAFGAGQKPMIDVFALTMCLMVGTAGLPHVIVRFYTVPSVKAARLSAGYALIFIAILYTTAPAVASFARYNMVNTLNDKAYAQAPTWFKNWERTGLVAWMDKNGDGVIQYRAGAPFKGKPEFTGEAGPQGQRLLKNAATDSKNELLVDNDIMVLANPEIANLPAWVVALVAAGGLAAALSTASGLLLVVASSISHDLYYRIINREATEAKRLMLGRVMIGLAVLVAGYFGINPPGFVAQVVALAFGLASASFFPILVLGIFWKRANHWGCVAGMLTGLGVTGYYMATTQPWLRSLFGVTTPLADSTWFGIAPIAAGVFGVPAGALMLVLVSWCTPAPAGEAAERFVDHLRRPGT
jgi:cation/acetate symporter